MLWSAFDCDGLKLVSALVPPTVISSGRTIKRETQAFVWAEADLTCSNGIWNNQLFQMWNFWRNFVKVRRQNIRIFV